MKFQDANIGDKVFLVHQQLALKKTHRIKGVTVEHPNSQTGVGIEHTVGQYVECVRLSEYEPRLF